MIENIGGEDKLAPVSLGYYEHGLNRTVPFDPIYKNAYNEAVKEILVEPDPEYTEYVRLKKKFDAMYDSYSPAENSTNALYSMSASKGEKP